MRNSRGYTNQRRPLPAVLLLNDDDDDPMVVGRTSQPAGIQRERWKSSGLKGGWKVHHRPPLLNASAYRWVDGNVQPQVPRTANGWRDSFLAMVLESKNCRHYSIRKCRIHANSNIRIIQAADSGLLFSDVPPLLYIMIKSMAKDGHYHSKRWMVVPLLHRELRLGI